MSNTGTGVSLYPSWLQSKGGATPSPLLDGLIHYWTLNESSGTRADSVGEWAMSPSGALTVVTGISGNGINIVTDNNLSNSSAAFDMNATDLSFNFWAQRVSNASSASRVFLAAAEGDEDLELLLYNNSVKLIMSDGDDNTINGTPVNMAAGWRMVTLLWSHTSRRARVYVDASADPGEDNTLDGSGSLAMTTLYLFAGNSASQTGAVDEMAMWDRLLLADEMTTLYNSGTGKFYPTFS